MSVPGEVLRIGLCVWLALIVAMIAWRLISGSISTAGLVSTRLGGSGDPERLQMFIGTIAGVAYYLWLSLSQLGTGDLQQLPDVPDVALSLLGGSQALYLSGKVARKNI